MKTPFEWTGELVFSDCSQEEKEEFVRQIQKDAYEQGFSDRGVVEGIADEARPEIQEQVFELEQHKLELERFGELL